MIIRRCASATASSIVSKPSARASSSAPRAGDLQWLLSRTRPFLGLHLTSQTCVIAASALALFDPLLMKWLVDEVLPMRRVAMLPTVAGALVGLYVARRALDAAAVLLTMQAVQRMLFRLRLRLLQRLHTLSADYYDRQSPGDLLYRLEHDVTQIGALGGDLIPLIARLITTGVVVLAAMFYLDPMLTATVLPLVPLFALVRWRMRQGLRLRADLAQARAAEATSFLQEHLSAVVQIQLLAAESTRARQYGRIAAASVRADVARRRAELLFGSLLSLVVIAGMATVLGVGGYRVMIGHLTVGSLVAFYGYTLQLFIPFYGASDLAARCERVAASVRRIREVEDTVSFVADGSEVRPLPRTAWSLANPRREPARHGRGVPDVRFEAVSFGYGDNERVLQEVSFHIRPGERVAIVGPSGSGKSSVGKLIARLYDVKNGTVFVGGRDVRRLDLKNLRQAVALVPQEPRLFDATLVDNLRCGLPYVAIRELEAAAAAAQLQPVLDRLPRGWNEPLGPDGRCLSGGERQRVALARAILRRPALLVLDEVTAGLDADTERALLQSLIQHAPGATLILISHRAAALSATERVLRLERGRLARGDCQPLV